MNNKTVSYADVVKDVGHVLQEINALGAKYGLSVLEMDKLTVEGDGGLAKIALVFSPLVLHECIEPGDGRA
jgi:hypothetical protein